MIAIDDLQFAYPGGRFELVVDELRVETGSSLALCGPSGCGKTTLLHLVAGLLPVARGSVRVGKRELRGLSEARRRAFRRDEVGLVFQNARLIDYLSVRDNILVVEHCAGFVRPLAKPLQRCAALAERLGIDHLLHQRSDRISQGEAQRVAIARALLREPPLVLADEPTASLDDTSAAATIDLLIAAAREQGATLVVATHDPRSRDACDARFDLPAAHAASSR
ncbi:MAG: ATP-binding cassette domain-containing protein [Planctomycetota bacterium]